MSDRSHKRHELMRDLRAARDLLDGLIEPARRGAFDKCDCDHNSIDHGFIREGAAAGFRPCLVPGCSCTDFDQSVQSWTEFERKRRMAEEQAEQEKRDAAESTGPDLREVA